MRIALEHVNTVRKRLRSGQTKTYYYHRLTGKRIECDSPGSLAFLRAYEAASIADAATEGTDTLGSLLRAYQASSDFRALAPATRAQGIRKISVLNDIFGATALSSICDKRFRAALLNWRDEIAQEYPAAAEAMVKQLKTITAFGEARGLIDLNPLRHLQCLKKRTRAEMTWKPEDVAKTLQRAATPARRAILLALLTTQRKSDLIRLKWSDIDGGFITLTQMKTGAPVRIPLGPSLKALLAEIPREADTILASSYGRSWADASGMIYHFAMARAEAGITGLTFHDLRGTAITAMADQGCSDIQIASLTGHSVGKVSTIKSLGSYLKRTEAQAVAAMDALERSWIGQLQTK